MPVLQTAQTSINLPDSLHARRALEEIARKATESFNLLRSLPECRLQKAKAQRNKE